MASLKKEKEVDKWEVTLSDWLPITIATILFLTTILYFFTREPMYDWYDIKHSGTVGDAIGGITSPFINLLGAILVYVSFLAQNRANRAQREALAHDRERISKIEITQQVENLLKDIEQELNNLNLTFQEKRITDDINNQGEYTYTTQNLKSTGAAAIRDSGKILGNKGTWDSDEEFPDLFFLLDRAEFKEFLFQIEYIQVMLLSITSYLKIYDIEKQSLLYNRCSAFYRTKLKNAMVSLAHGLSETHSKYKKVAYKYVLKQTEIDSFLSSGSLEGLKKRLKDIKTEETLEQQGEKK